MVGLYCNRVKPPTPTVARLQKNEGFLFIGGGTGYGTYIYTSLGIFDFLFFSRCGYRIAGRTAEEMEHAERGLRRGGGRVGGVLDRHGGNRRRMRSWANRRKYEVVSRSHGFRAVVAVAGREAGGGLGSE